MAADATRYREDFDLHGLSATQEQVIAWVPAGSRVLELGCSSGYIGQILRDEKRCAVTGVEVDPAAAEEARARGLDVRQGSLESEAFRASITGPFDVVIAADVLEHLAEPERVLEHFKRWMTPGGRAIVAVPNVATWEIRARLFFRGDFEYQETGILDRTHLHHFSWDTFHALVRRQGFRIEETMVEGWAIPFATQLFYHWPQELRARLARTPAHSAAGRAVKQAAFDLAGRWFKVGEAMARPLLRTWPNLCAPHLALKLALPERAR